MKNRNLEKIKEQITLGTRRLVAAGGMSNFSFPKLSAETGIAAPTVYEHYKNKEDLLTSCYLAIDAEIGALLSGFLQNDPPHRHELEKIDVYCRALWAAYWRYLTADADRTLFYWSFYHSEYYHAGRRRAQHSKLPDARSVHGRARQALSHLRAP